MIKIFEIIVLLMWVIGIFAPREYQPFFWAVPAGWAGGTIIAKLLLN